MHSTQICLMNDMLSELKDMRESMDRQIHYITGATEKFNNVLLQIESARAAKATHKSENCETFVYSKNLKYTLLRIIEDIVNILPKYNTLRNENSYIQREDVQNMEDQAELLASSIRKLLVLSDIIRQMCATKLNQDFESNKNTKEN